MKYNKLFSERINCKNEDEVFKYLINTVKQTITKWDYFVNWNKVFNNVKKIEMDLNLLNYLIGKDNIKNAFADLLKEYPSVANTVPALIAARNTNFKILSDYGYKPFDYKDFSFRKNKSLTEEEIKATVEFVEKTGFLGLLASKKIKNVVDYVIGVEVGLDTNGRKNRTGTMMEGILEFFVKDICERNNFEYMGQATSAKVKQKWDLDLTVEKSSRKIDFAVYNGTNLYLIETNFYSGVGSKLKSTAGEYKTMYDYWKNDGHKFVWVTDGAGWVSTHLPLRETFDYTDYILNLEMLSKKILEDIIVGNL